MSNSSLEDLHEALQGQGVTKIERMKAKVGGQLIDTNRYVLTFNKPEIPRTISITDWHHELVELYLPRPMRCTMCQRIGHTYKRCRHEEPTCATCSQTGHRAGTCQREAKCCNCGGLHAATDNNCPLYVFKTEVLATQVRLKKTYLEAEEDVRERFHASGKKHTFPPRRSHPKPPATPPSRTRTDSRGEDILEELQRDPSSSPSRVPNTQVILEPGRKEGDPTPLAETQAEAEIHNPTHSKSPKKQDKKKQDREMKKRAEKKDYDDQENFDLILSASASTQERTAEAPFTKEPGAQVEEANPATASDSRKRKEVSPTAERTEKKKKDDSPNPPQNLNITQETPGASQTEDNPIEYSQIPVLGTANWNQGKTHKPPTPKTQGNVANNNRQSKKNNNRNPYKSQWK